MKPLLITILLLDCGGPAFTELNEQDNNSSDTAGRSGLSTQAGGGNAQASAGGAGVAGTSQSLGGETHSQSKSSSSGASAMAGGPAMGEGGTGSGSAGEGSLNSAACLINHQNLACAQVCDSSPYCQGILDCLVNANSLLTSSCPGFSDTGYTLAAQAVRNCCHD